MAFKTLTELPLTGWVPRHQKSAYFVVGVKPKDVYLTNLSNYLKESESIGFDLNTLDWVALVTISADGSRVSRVPVMEFYNMFSTKLKDSLVNATISREVITGQFALNLNYSNKKMAIFDTNRVITGENAVTVLAKYVVDKNKVDEINKLQGLFNTADYVNKDYVFYGVYSPTKGIGYISEKGLKSIVTKDARNKDSLVTVKINGTTGDLSAINYKMPVFDIISMDKEFSLGNVLNRGSDGLKNDKSIKRMTKAERHARHRNKIVARYMSLLLKGGIREYIVSSRAANKGSLQKKLNRDIEILFEEVFAELYPDRVEFFKREMREEPIFNIIEYFLVLLLADKGGYVNKKTGVLVNTGDITSYKYKLRIKDKLSPFKSLNTVQRHLYEDKLDVAVVSYFTIRNAILEGDYYSKKDKMNDIEKYFEPTSPLYRLLASYKPDYKKDDYEYRVGDLEFHKGKGFEALLVTKEDSKVGSIAKDSRIFRSVLYKDIELDSLDDSYRIGGLYYDSSILAFTTPKPEGEYVASYTIPALIKRYMESKNQLALRENSNHRKQLQLMALTLLLFDNDEMFECLAHPSILDINTQDFDKTVLKEKMKEAYSHMSEDENSSICSGYYLIPYHTYTRYESFKGAAYENKDLVTENATPAFMNFVKLLNLVLTQTGSNAYEEVIYPFGEYDNYLYNY